MEYAIGNEGQVIISTISEENNEMLRSAKVFIESIPGELAKFGWSLIIAVIVLFVGFKVCKIIRKALNKVMGRANVDPAVIHFTDATANVIIKVLLIFAAASIIGFDKAGITAMIGSVSIAIGLAVQGSLSNFAGGILILTLKPFVLGDYIVETGSKQEGIVEHISIFYTKIRDDFGNIVILPNGTLANSTMVNKTNGNNFRYASVLFQVAYKEDIEKVKKVLLDALDKETKYFRHDIAKNVAVTKLDDSGVEMKAVVGIDRANYMNACYALNEIIKKTLDDEGISIPFPQVDVHFDK